MSGRVRSRWLGLVPYAEAEALQRAIHEHADTDYLLLQEHPHVYTLGSSAKPEHVLRDPASVGATLVEADRGGDVTYHGPGQLVGYPIISLAEWRAGQRDVVAYVRKLEDVLIAVCADFGITAGRSRRVHRRVGRRREDRGDRRARVARAARATGSRSNVDPDLSMFEHIVPCGIRDRGVTSMARLLGRPVEMRAVVDRVVVAFRRGVRRRRRRSPGRRVAAPTRTTHRAASPSRSRASGPTGCGCAPGSTTASSS